MVITAACVALGAIYAHRCGVVQVHVCGRPEVDVALLKSNTVYRSCSKDDPHIQCFWAVSGFAAGGEHAAHENGEH